jgi:dipeptidyl aminopeptidase/acylaminoacyl peptidase
MQCKPNIQKAPIIPLEDFFKNPEKSSYQISPDGKYFSYMAPYQDRMNIFVQEIGTEEAVRITEELDRDIAGYFWGSNDRILYLKDKGGDENYYLVGVNPDGTNLIPLTEFPDVRTDIIDDLEDIPSEVIVGLNKRNPQIFDAYRLNTDTGELTMIAENPGNIQGWMTDHDGKLRLAFAVAEDGLTQQVLYRETEKDPFKIILTTDYTESFSPEFFTFDNKNLYALSNIGRDKTALVEFNLTDLTETQLLYENPNYDLNGASYSKTRKVITGCSWTGVKTERHFFDEITQKRTEKIETQLQGYEFVTSSVTKDEKKRIIRTYSDRSLGAYYLYDDETGTLEKIADVSPWIDEKIMASVNPITYTSRDGLTINGYLTLPVGYTMENAKNLPVVVNPHGGPWHRDRWGFNPEIQFLANRGYAVFQMNFRGSTGYGKDFWKKSFKQWGLTMQDDITDGVEWLISQGIADKNRIAIYGGSYGGYATLQGLVKTPDLYACGIDYVGVSNLFTFMNTFPPYWELMRQMLYEMVGDPVKDSLILAENSPVINVEKIKAPLFVAQGANDPRVNKAESDQMVEALNKRGVQVEYLVKDNEGHGFHNQENQFEFYRAMENFLAEHLLK